MRAEKEILKASLRGIAELHDRQVVHLGNLSHFCTHRGKLQSSPKLAIKPDNVMADDHHNGQETIVEQVQIIDLENTGYFPKGRCIKGMLAGNDDGRSPEAHFKANLTNRLTSSLLASS
jgi:hypothetical protein